MTDFALTFVISGSQKLLARPSIGRAGRKIQLRANFLPTRVPTHGDIYHYDVVILPECPRVVNHKVIRKLTVEYEKVFKKDKPVFDGKKNIYSRDPLPIKNDGVSAFDRICIVLPMLCIFYPVKTMLYNKADSYNYGSCVVWYRPTVLLSITLFSCLINVRKLLRILFRKFLLLFALENL